MVFMGILNQWDNEKMKWLSVSNCNIVFTGFWKHVGNNSGI
jgi:hypothetical protein